MQYINLLHLPIRVFGSDNLPNSIEKVTCKPFHMMVVLQKRNVMVGMNRWRSR